MWGVHELCKTVSEGRFVTVWTGLDARLVRRYIATPCQGLSASIDSLSRPGHPPTIYDALTAEGALADLLIGGRY